jgi:hypothetical protein
MFEAGIMGRSEFKVAFNVYPPTVSYPTCHLASAPELQLHRREVRRRLVFQELHHIVASMLYRVEEVVDGECGIAWNLWQQYQCGASHPNTFLQPSVRVPVRMYRV